MQPSLSMARWIIAMTIVTIFSTATLADPPAIASLFRRKTTATPQTPMLLATEHGPWLILAHKFEGEVAEQKAMELALELRNTYGLTAYIYPKSFDYTETVPGSGFDSKGNQKRMRYVDSRAVDCYAVVVGDFNDAENPKYEEALKIIKCAKPKTLGGDGSNPGADIRGSWGEVRKLISTKKKETKLKAGPMYLAFGTPNPLLPKDFFRPPMVDKFVKGLNDQVEYSLLENPGRFTLRIASFRGEDAVAIQNKQNGNPETIEGAALAKAEELADTAVKLLRAQGIDAYQFHDRDSSIVTVGSFESIGQNDAQGVFSYDPAIQQTMMQFGGVKEFRQSQFGNAPIARTLLDVISYRKIPELNRGSEKEKMALVKKYSIPLDLNPTVMAVPKFEKKSIYAGSLLGQR